MSWLDALVNVGVSLGSTFLQNQANKDARDDAQQGINNANQISEAAKQRGIGAVKAGGAEARGYLGNIAGYSQGGPDYLRSVVARSPAQLDPDQKLFIDDVTRTAKANVASSSLRGAGRAGVASVNDAITKAKAGAFAENRARADRAGSVLEGRFAQAQTGGANLAATEGRAIANTELGVGTQQANNAVNAGDINAYTTLANGRLAGDTIGQIQSIFADQQKQDALKDVYNRTSSKDLYQN